MNKKTYYDEIIEKLEKAINTQDWDSAQKILSDELSMPYIPQEFKDKLMDYNRIISSNIIEKRFNELNEKTISAEKILETILSDDESIINKTVAANKLATINVRLILEQLLEYVADPRKPSTIKVFIVDALVQQGINKKIVFAKSDEEHNVDLSEMPQLKDLVEIKIASKILEKLVDDQVVLQMSLTLLEAIFWITYPIIPQEIQLKTFAATAYFQTKKALKHEVSTIEVINLFDANTMLFKDLNDRLEKSSHQMSATKIY